MALSRPTRLSPNKASGGYQAINGQKGITVNKIVKDKTVFLLTSPTSDNTNYISTPFEFTVNGSSSIESIKIIVYDIALKKNVFSSNITGHYSSEDKLYSTNHLGEDTVLKAYIPLKQNNVHILGNSIVSNYKWYVTVYWKEYQTVDTLIEKNLTSAEAYFESRESLEITSIIIDKQDLTNNKVFNFIEGEGTVGSVTLSGLSHTFEATRTPIYVPIDYFNWRLRDAYDNVIHDTGRIFAQEVKFEYDGFLPLKYTLDITIVNQAGNISNQSMVIESSNTITKLNTILQVQNNSMESSLMISWGDSSSNFIINELVAESIITPEDKSNVKFDLYRRKKGELYSQYLFTFSNEAFYCNDYMVGNESEYSYFMYPIKDNQVLGECGTFVTTNPRVIKYHKVDFWGWVLLVLVPNPNQEETVYKVFKEYVWGANLNSTSIKTSYSSSINENFTPYPRVQKGRQNYLNISLKSLIGYIDCETNDYIDTQELINDVRMLPFVENEMILKNSKGAVMRVVPSSEVNYDIDEKSSKLLTSISLSFVEVGRLNNMSVINKVVNPAWMFTQSGYQPINTISSNLSGYSPKKGEYLSGSNVTKE